jgi:hypothetical protein
MGKEAGAQMSQLIIPDIRTTNLPVGWAEVAVIPTVMEAAWDDLDEYEAGLRAMASYIESLEKGDAVELEKALRIIEARRGELLGLDAGPGRPAKLSTRGQLSEVANATANRYRKIARHWQTIWPELARSTDRRDVSQAAVLRMIERIEEAAKPVKSPDKTPDKLPSRKPDPNAEPELENDGWGEVDPIAELEMSMEREAKQAELIEHLTKEDKNREILALHSRIAGLEARIGQLTNTAREAQKQADIQGKVLRKLRDVLSVERNSEIITRVEALI